MVQSVDQMFAELDRPAAPQRQAIQKISYSHAAMIDMIIASPGISQNELAARFGYTASWISTVMATDAWQTAFAARMEEVVDPLLKATVEEQFKGLLRRSMEVLRAKLDEPIEKVPPQLALKVFELSSRAAGYGVRDPAPVQVNVVQHIEDHSERLVALLRHTKRQVISQEILDEETLR